MKKGIFVITLMLLFSAALFAYQLSPLSATYDPSGAGSARVYTITNDSDSPIAIEINAFSRNIDIDGRVFPDSAETHDHTSSVIPACARPVPWTSNCHKGDGI